MFRSIYDALPCDERRLPLRFSQIHYARFVSRLDTTSSKHGCHIFTGCKDKDGYGLAYDGEKTIRAHRLAWLINKGPIPAEKEVCHNCPGGDNRACCNIDHLWLGTTKQNIADRDIKGRCNPQSGDQHWSRRHPEWVARGDRSGARTHPEKHVKGNTHPRRLHPEKYVHLRGDTHKNSKLKAADVPKLLADLKSGHYTQRQLAKKYGFRSRNVIYQIITKKTWRHVLCRILM